MVSREELSQNNRNYLLLVYRMSEGKGETRLSEIADAIEVSKPTALEHIGRLIAMGLIKPRRYGPVRLSDDGREIASVIDARCTTVSQFLRLSLGLEQQEARDSACLIEHNMAPEVLSRMENYVENAE